MIKPVLSTLWVLLLHAAVATAQVNFERTTNLDQLLAKATKERKLIFIDGYTDWCGWCKVLDQKVFCKGPVADTMNAYFVSTKLEMEKDSIGVMLARKYAIMGFPTALILNPEGRLVAVLSGYSDAYLDRIMPVIRAGIQQPVIKGYSETLQPDFPSFYLDMFPFDGKKRTPPKDSVVNAFLESQTDITSEVSWNVINRFYYKLNKQQGARVVSQIEPLKNLYGSELIQGILHRIFSHNVYQAIQAHDDQAFNDALRDGAKHLNEPAWFLFNSKIDRYKNDSNWKAMANLIAVSIPDTTIGLSPTALNQYAWDLYQSCNDRDALHTAIKWMEHPVLVKDPQYNHLDTYAALLFKTGQLKAAQKAAVKAIAAGKKEQQKDLTATETLLQKIDAALQRKKATR